MSETKVTYQAGTGELPETIEELIQTFADCGWFYDVNNLRDDCKKAKSALLDRFEALEAELADERAGRALLAKATDRIAQLENENTELLRNVDGFQKQLAQLLGWEEK